MVHIEFKRHRSCHSEAALRAGDGLFGVPTALMSLNAVRKRPPARDVDVSLLMDSTPDDGPLRDVALPVLRGILRPEGAYFAHIAEQLGDEAWQEAADAMLAKIHHVARPAARGKFSKASKALLRSV